MGFAVGWSESGWSETGSDIEKFSGEGGDITLKILLLLQDSVEGSRKVIGG